MTAAVVRASVLWDMDGVLVDSTSAHFEAWKQTGAARGVAIDWERFRPTFGMANPDAIRVLFGDVAPDEARRIADAKEIAFRHLLVGKTRALPGAEALVRALAAAGHRQAVASSAPRANIDALLGELAFGACFDAIACGDEISRGKPDPEIFLRAAAKLGAAPHDCIVVEDADVGVEAAKRAGMRAYAVTTTRSRDELAAADRIVGSLDDLDVEAFVLRSAST